MIKIVRRAGMLLLTGALLSTMISCGKKESNIEIVEESKNEPKYLSFFSQKILNESDLGKYWSDRFAQAYNQEIYVNYDAAAYYGDEGLSYRELLEKRLKSGSPDDMYIINAEDVMEFGKKGYWMDLSELDFVNNLSEAALYQSTYDGKVFSVPLTFTGFGFYWNVTLLEEYGLSVPENLDEFLTVCEELKAQGVLPYGANKGYALTVPLMCKSLSKLYGNPDKDKNIEELNSGEQLFSTYMKEGFEFLTYIIDQGYLDTQQALNATPGVDDVQLFKEGKCAFICIGLVGISQETEDYGFRQDFTGLPLLEDGCISVYGADKRLCVNPNSKQLDTVLKFIEMVGTRDALDESAQVRGQTSSAKDSVLQLPAIQRKMADLLQQPGQIPNQDFALHFNTWENIRNVGREICDGMSVEKACEMIDELQRTELELYAENEEK